MYKDITAINEGLTRDARGFIRAADGVYDAQVEAVAADIVRHHRQRPLVLLSGPSGSGKTTTARILEEKLRRQGIGTHTVSMDEFFHPLDGTQKAQMARGELDLESPDRVDAALLGSVLQDLLAGKPRRVFVNHGADTVCDAFAATVTEQLGIPATAPYSGGGYDLLADTCLDPGNRTRLTAVRPRGGTSRSEGVFNRLLAAGRRLLTVIEHNRGGSNKDLARFADQIQSLADKWDR